MLKAAQISIFSRAVTKNFTKFINKNKLNIISYSDYINYLIDKHDDKIKELLNKIMDKDNYTKYKYIGLYILNKKPEFIIDNVKNYIS